MSKHREFQIFAKPIGSACNLHCTYCYYHNSTVGENAFPKLMNDDFLEEYIRQHIAATTSDIILFSWHGGEPILAGIEFYRKAIAIQKRLIPRGKKLINGIQTNGTLLTREWCRFLSDENFMVGISIDGPAHLHDNFRVTQHEKSSFFKVIEGYNLLQSFGITTEILCVVNAVNVLFPMEVYRFFKSLNARFITFLPLVEIDSGIIGGVSDKSVQPEDFGRFLIEIYDEWVENDMEQVTIQIFEETLQTAFRKEHTLCVFKENCGGVPVVESNGDFYACDHFVSKRFLIGNIHENSISDLLDSSRQVEFGMAKSLTLPEYCKSCGVKTMCNGECPKNRFAIAPNGDAGLNYLCAGYKLFFTHCMPLVEELRRQAVKEN